MGLCDIREPQRYDVGKMTHLKRLVIRQKKELEKLKQGWLVSLINQSEKLKQGWLVSLINLSLLFKTFCLTGGRNYYLRHHKNYLQWDHFALKCFRILGQILKKSFVVTATQWLHGWRALASRVPLTSKRPSWATAELSKITVLCTSHRHSWHSFSKFSINQHGIARLHP